jgi:hypothetical protein
MKPTQTICSNFSPVMPSYRSVLPSVGRPAAVSCDLISASVAPSNTGVEKCRPSECAAQPRWVSRI